MILQPFSEEKRKTEEKHREVMTIEATTEGEVAVPVAVEGKAASTAENKEMYK